MKLLYDYAIFSMQRMGGVSRVMSEVISRALAAEDLDAHVWGGLHAHAGLQRIKRSFPERVHAWSVPQQLARYRLLAPLNRRFFPSAARRGRPALCHYTFFETSTLPKETKKIFTVHDLIHERYGEHYPANDRQRSLRQKALAEADAIICVSDNTRRDLEEFYAVGDIPVIVAYNGNSLAGVTPQPIHRDRPFWLCVGTRGAWHKNVDVLWQALAQASAIEDHELVHFGGGPLTSSELRRIHELGLTNRVHQIEGSDTLLAGHYAAAQGLIFPSRYEGFGMPLVEAMSQGCPVIASSALPMPEIVADAGLFFDPDSPEALCKIMVQLHSDNTLCRSLVERGYKRAQHFSWDKSCAQVLNLYRQMLQNGIQSRT